MAEYTNILYEQTGLIAKLTLNRPAKLNAMSSELLAEFGDALDRLARDDAVRTVIITGAGRAFSTGYDIAGTGHPLTSLPEWRDYLIHGELDVLMKIWDLDKPTIAAVRGYALGGGLDLALLCTITLASEDALFGAPEVRHCSGPTYLLPFMIGMKKTAELLLTGASISALEAERLGIVNHVVPSDQLDAAAMTMAQKLASIPPFSMKLNRIALRHAYETMGMRQAIAYGVEVLTILLNSPESQEFQQKVQKKGLKAALAERDEVFS